MKPLQRDVWIHCGFYALNKRQKRSGWTCSETWQSCTIKKKTKASQGKLFLTHITRTDWCKMIILEIMGLNLKKKKKSSCLKIERHQMIWGNMGQKKMGGWHRTDHPAKDGGSTMIYVGSAKNHSWGKCAGCWNNSFHLAVFPGLIRSTYHHVCGRVWSHVSVHVAVRSLSSPRRNWVKFTWQCTSNHTGGKQSQTQPWQPSCSSNHIFVFASILCVDVDTENCFCCSRLKSSLKSNAMQSFMRLFTLISDVSLLFW